jgi:hypothetical protein
MFYFLVERPCPTAYSELHPGIATTLPVQQRIVQELEARHVHWVVLWDAPLSEEKNASASSSGVTLLDACLQECYAPVAHFGRYEILKARNPNRGGFLRGTPS